MKLRLLQWLQCPACGAVDLALETARAENRRVYTGHYEPGEVEIPGVDLERGEEQEVLEGALHCGGCGAGYLIRDGIPRMVRDLEEEETHTGHRWTHFDASVPEWERDFLEYVQPFARPDFLGKLVLDAGCGFGRHSFFAARYGAEVLAIDSSADAVQATAHNTRGLERVHVIQGDLHAPPIREGSVDLAMCFGVLHHLQQADEVFEVLGRSVRPGGRFSLWVYGPRQGAALTLTQALRGWTVGLEPIELYRLSQAIALGLRVFSHTPYRFLRGAPGIGSIVNHLPIHDHHRWPRPVVVADVYDRLRIPVTDWFKGEQLEVWYADQGYADVDVTRRVRNNETFLATGLRR